MLITQDDKIVTLIHGKLISWDHRGKTQIILNKPMVNLNLNKDNRKRKHEDTQYKDVLCVTKRTDGKIIGIDMDDYLNGRFNSYTVYLWE